LFLNGKDKKRSIEFTELKKKFKEM